MNSEVLNLILGMYLLGAFALQAKNWHAWGVLLIGVMIACAGAWAGYDFTIKGQDLGSAQSMYFSQVLLVFSSVLGGALASTAFSELRATKKSD